MIQLHSERKIIVAFIFISFLIIGTLGVLNHFIYDWGNQSNVLAFFAATDESVFEHMKLALWPWIWTIFVVYIMRFSGGFRKFDFIQNLCSSTIGLGIYIGFIPLSFYLYTEALGYKHNLPVDIVLYFVSVLLGTMTWGLLSVYSVHIVMDVFVFLSLLSAFLIWFTTCSYTSCSNIYVDQD